VIYKKTKGKCKGKGNVDLYSAYSQTPLTRSGMAHIIKKISQFYLHTPRSSVDGMNHTCLASLPKLVLIYRPRRDGRLSWPGQSERWVNSRPRTVTQCLSQLLIGQRHWRLTGQTGVSGLHRATARQPQPVGQELSTSEVQAWRLSHSSTTPQNASGKCHGPVDDTSHLSLYFCGLSQHYSKQTLSCCRHVKLWIVTKDRRPDKHFTNANEYTYTWRTTQDDTAIKSVLVARVEHMTTPRWLGPHCCLMMINNQRKCVMNVN